jgi:hypothetical protein
LHQKESNQFADVYFWYWEHRTRWLKGDQQAKHSRKCQQL